MEPIEGQPIIEYPTLWEYRLIGRSRSDIRAAVVDVLGEKAPSLAEGNSSPAGKYVSMSLELTVRDEAHRNEIFGQFKAHASIVMVL